VNNRPFVLLFVSLLLVPSVLLAQSRYTVTLHPTEHFAWVQHDLAAAGKESTPKGKETTYQFPMTVPGTYATLDYGRFIENFAAFDASGKKLRCRREGNNAWKIGGEPSRVMYQVLSIMEEKVGKNKIFEPASAYFHPQTGAVINGGAVFGFVPGHVADSAVVEILHPGMWWASSSLPRVASNSDRLVRAAALEPARASESFLENRPAEGPATRSTVFGASNYHALIDNPMLVAPADTAGFWVNNTRVTVACLDFQGKQRAAHFKSLLEADLQAVAKFMPVLPVDRYTFLITVADFREAGQVIQDMQQGNVRPFALIKTLLLLKDQGLGALEHNTSSLYFLGDFGVDIPDLNLDGQLASSAVHEFMHIVTPLGLHAPAIHDFNYANPTMSQHLWLYEGVTEYFSHLIRLQGGRVTVDAFLDEMEGKIRSGERFPYARMSFAEMSTNVLEKGYKEQYGHVYDRGAVLAWLLDAEIRRLTNDSKTLADVILDLHAQYGPKRPFDEAGFYDAFAAASHPEIRSFFAQYIEGRQALPYREILQPLGVTYRDTVEVIRIVSPLDRRKNDIRMLPASSTGHRTVKKVGKNNWSSLQEGDVVHAEKLAEALKAATDTIVYFPVVRNGKADMIPFPVRKETSNLYRQLDGYGMNPDLPVDPAALFRWSMFTQGALKRTFSTEPITVPTWP
jgi:predicted metalloprotease with PDZ domain